MDDHQRSDGIPVTRFTLQSIYAQSDDEKLQFEYESGNTKILVRWYLCYISNCPQVLREIESKCSATSLTMQIYFYNFSGK